MAALPALLLALVGAAVHAAPAWAAFPGENGRIAFSRQISPRSTAIYSMASDGGDVRRLTTAGGFHWSPAWSPDGTRLAFASNRDGDFDIYVINADGSDQRRVTDDPADELDPTWSPDGTRLAYSSRRELFAIGVDGRAERQLTAFGQLPFWPSWAPDGSEIAFTLGRSLAAVPPAGAGTARRIGRGGPRLQLTPDWSPDATRLAFGGEGLTMWSIGRDGTGLSPVSRTIAGYDVAWSPDGRRLVFVSNQDARLHVIDAAGGGEMVLVRRDKPAWRWG